MDLVLVFTKKKNNNNWLHFPPQGVLYTDFLSMMMFWMSSGSLHRLAEFEFTSVSATATNVKQ